MPSLSRRHFLQTSSSLAAFALLRANPSFAAEADLIVRSEDPYNAEPRLLALVADQITPVNHFYVRSHGPMPSVEVRDFKLTVDGMVGKPLTLSLDDIKGRFKKTSVEATLICGGSRRQEQSAIKPVGGVQWDAGPIGNATWSGVSLYEILEAAAFDTKAKHIWFEGLDPIKEKDGSVAPFGGSIPISKVRSFTIPPAGKVKSPRQIIEQSVVLAHSMNDQPLTREHGFPLRSIVPGYIGARSVKWLTKITLSDKPSPNHYVAEAYKVVQSDSKDEAAAAEPIYDFPINAAICAPAAGATIKAGQTRISGYALPSGGATNKIDQVEVSADGGHTWSTARLIGAPAPFTWQHWTADLSLKAGKHELVARASDTSGHKMPERGEWNFKGYLYNGWHRIQVEAV
jgi:sulfite oxidase